MLATYWMDEQYFLHRAMKSVNMYRWAEASPSYPERLCKLLRPLHCLKLKNLARKQGSVVILQRLTLPAWILAEGNGEVGLRKKPKIPQSTRKFDLKHSLSNSKIVW